MRPKERFTVSASWAAGHFDQVSRCPCSNTREACEHSMANELGGVKDLTLLELVPAETMTNIRRFLNAFAYEAGDDFLQEQFLKINSIEYWEDD